MSKHLASFILLMASLQAFAIDTQVPALHWELPTTLHELQSKEQELSKLLLDESSNEMPVSIMCQRQYGWPERSDWPGWSGKSDKSDWSDKSERYWTVKRDLTLASVPYIVLGITAHTIKRDVRKVNTDINTGFHNRADDYIQWAPLALTYGLKATGYQGRSQWGRLLVSNAFSGAIMAAIVNGIKYSAAEERPDGSTCNSFPSGHTATAFMAATVLHKEYGLTRSLWYSVGGYTVATGIATFRVMNNRHWVSDVLTGAGIGILSTELGYAISDLIFKDKYTIRREMENLNDVSEHPSFFSLQAGTGFVMGAKSIPQEITEAGGPLNIKQGISTVLGAEAAYFLNPYLGFGVRARINSTAVTPRWNETDEVWTSGTLHYNSATNQYEHPVTSAPEYKYGTETHKDQMSSFDIMGGVYGSLPLNKRMSLGAKLLFGHRKNGDVWYIADMSGNDNDYMAKVENFEKEMLKMENLEDVNTYDRIKGIYLDGRGSFMFGTGVSFSYALKHNIVWRICLDYDFTRAHYDYEFENFSLVDETNAYLSSVNTGGNVDDEISGKTGSFKRSLHQITPSFGICFSF